MQQVFGKTNQTDQPLSIRLTSPHFYLKGILLHDQLRRLINWFSGSLAPNKTQIQD